VSADGPAPRDQDRRDPGFPADVLFNFRLYSVAAQVLLWSAIGLNFALLAGRLLAPGPASAELRTTEPAGV
jgi:hypothetical protein